MPEPPPETNTVRPARLGYGRPWREIRLQSAFVSHYDCAGDDRIGMTSCGAPDTMAAGTHSAPRHLHRVLAALSRTRSPHCDVQCITSRSRRDGPARQSFQARDRFRQDRPIGSWLVSAAPSTAEALGCVGFDFLVVDMEHTPIDTPQMIGILQTIAGTPAQPIVRPPWNDMVMVKRALDAGAQTLLLPVRAERRRSEARRGVHALSAGRRARRRRHAPRQPLRHGPELPQACARRSLRDRADRDAGGVRPARRDRRGAGRRLDLHRPERTCRRRWAIWATSATPRCRTKLAAGAQTCQSARQALRHHRSDARRWSANFSTTASPGSPSARTSA